VLTYRQSDRRRVPRGGASRSAAGVVIADRDGHVTFEAEHQRNTGSCFPCVST